MENKPTWLVHRKNTNFRDGDQGPAEIPGTSMIGSCQRETEVSPHREKSVMGLLSEVHPHVAGAGREVPLPSSGISTVLVIVIPRHPKAP